MIELIFFQLICRSATPMPESAKEKISMFSNVNLEQVICLPDVNNIFKVPIILDDHNLAAWFVERLSLDELLAKIDKQALLKHTYMQKWRDLSEK